MTQRIFDVENEKDMALLWSILPDKADRVMLSRGCQAWFRKKGETGYNLECIKINWHDKTEITRPIQEATNSDSGKLCKFWNKFGEEYAIYGILSKKCNDNGIIFYTVKKTNAVFDHARRLTKQEIEELI